MSVDDKLSAKPQIDTTDFKTGITTMNRELKVLESGFRASAAELGDWSKSATGLESRITTLNSKIDIQKQKVEATRKEFERIRTEQGENSRAAQDMEIKLNRETESLANMTNELRTTENDLVELKKDADAASESTVKLAKFSDILKASLSGVRGMARGLIVELKGVATVIKGELAASLAVLKVGTLGVLGLGTAAVVAGVALVGMTFHAAAASDQLGELSDKTGISVTNLQKLDFIGKVIGTDLDTITGANARLIRSMNTAGSQSDKFEQSLDKQSVAIQKAQIAYEKAIKAHGKNSAEAKNALAKLNEEYQQFSDKSAGGVAQAFDTLHVKIRDANGDLRDNQVVFKEIIDALGRVADPTERDALAMTIFGKSAQELNPLIKLGAKGFQELADKAELVGAVVDQKTITALGDLNDQLDILKSGAKGLGTTVLGAFAPFFSGALQTATGYLEQLFKLVKGSKGDFGALAGNLGGFFTSIIQDLARAAPQLITVGLKIVMSLLKSILAAAPELIKAAVQIIKLLSDAIITNLPILSQSALSILPTLINAILTALPELFKVGINILSTIIDALVSALPKLIPDFLNMAAALFSQMFTAIETAFPLLLPIAVQLIQTLITFLRDNLFQIIQIGVPLISQLVQAILPQLPLLIDAALKIIIALANGITQQLPILLPVIVNVIIQIVQTLIDNLPLVIQAALLLIIALAQGLVQALPALISAVPALIQGLVNAIVASLPMIYKAAGKIIGELAKGILFNIPVALFAIVDLIVRLGQTLGLYMRDIGPKLGRYFIDGLAAGFKSGASYLYSVVSNVISGMVSNIHDILLMRSPSKVGEGIGQNFISSIGSGGKKAAKDVQQMFSQLTGQLSLAASTGLSVAGQTINNNNSQQVKNITIPITATVNNRQDVDYLVQQVKQRLVDR